MKKLLAVMVLSMAFLSGTILPQVSMSPAQAKEVKKKGKLKPNKKLKHKKTKRAHKKKKAVDAELK